MMLKSITAQEHSLASNLVAPRDHKIVFRATVGVLCLTLAIVILTGCQGTAGAGSSNPGNQTIGITANTRSVTLQTEASQPFTAAVTGTSNTGVRWAATGGTVTISGNYTAG